MPWVIDQGTDEDRDWHMNEVRSIRNARQERGAFAIKVVRGRLSAVQHQVKHWSEVERNQPLHNENRKRKFAHIDGKYRKDEQTCDEKASRSSRRNFEGQD